MQIRQIRTTVLAADLAAAAVNDVGTGTGIAAIQRQLGGVDQRVTVLLCLKKNLLKIIPL